MTALTALTTPVSRPALRRAVGVLFLAALAVGCGIRPTAVPVDAGAPASRTACPTTPHIPTALATPSPAGPTVVPPRTAAKPGVSPSPTSATASPVLPPSDNVFSALPTPSAPTSAPCR
ncbi:hypothetical protein [Kitasatospora sp. NPDC088548]|uniref:hypothetical protein n=1 Tax=Kitasatospora sp. NPDC088548 TaxID=3364075 RepID=UPI00382EEED3